MSGVDILAIRKRLGRDGWHPPQPYGPMGYSLVSRNLKWQIIVQLETHDGCDYIRAALGGFDEQPTLTELQMLHWSVFGEGMSYQVFPPGDPRIMQLIGRADGEPALPGEVIAGAPAVPAT